MKNNDWSKKHQHSKKKSLEVSTKQRILNREKKKTTPEKSQIDYPDKNQTGKYLIVLNLKFTVKY